MIQCFLLAAGVLAARGQDDLTAARSGLPIPAPRFLLTNAMQFQTLSGKQDFFDCAFHLQGVVTLVDTDRDLVVLQDSTGAVAVNFKPFDARLQTGFNVRLEGTNCHPYVANFPDYPFRTSGWDIRKSFEAPSDWGDYHLTRMRAQLHPPATGEYTFWIASDNSSELWLSADDKPQNARKIAGIPRYGYVRQQDWSHYPSQRAEAVLLEAGRNYYIEAFQEQMTMADNLAVAWEGPGVKQAVIEGRYLTPWAEPGGRDLPAGTNGVLREYWTNYSSGDLSIITAPKPFESAVSVAVAEATLLGPGKFPAGRDLPLNQPVPPNENFHWVRVEGVVQFFGEDGAGALLELTDGPAQVQVRVSHWDSGAAGDLNNGRVRVEGVCEGGNDENGNFVLEMIRSPSEEFVSLLEPGGTNFPAAMAAHTLTAAAANGDSAMEGFFSTRGVVTFNDRVFDKDYLFVQQDTTAISVSLKDRKFRNELEVGQLVELGGALRPGRTVPVLSPMSVRALGWHLMPEPVAQPIEFPMPASKDGRWTEVEGVVRSVNTNGTMSIKGRAGTLRLWIGQISSDFPNRYVNAKLRVRGVLSFATPDAPVLLVPSRRFVNVEENAPADTFRIPASAIANLSPDTADPALVHRVKIRGDVVGRDGGLFFVQDASGGIRVRPVGAPMVKVGDAIEAVGFPDLMPPNRILAEALIRPASSVQPAEPRALDWTDPLSSRQRDTLVQVSATVLNQSDIGTGQLLELQEQQRVFTATMLNGQSRLPAIAPGSRVRVTGVCDEGIILLPATGKPPEKAATGSLNILLREAADVVVLSGPPWWTLKRTVMLVGALLSILVVTLLWVHLLRRRLERQQAARLAFSRQILQGQESERQRIAINLHDSLGQNLLVIKNQARLAMQTTSDEAARQGRLNKISEITSQAIEEVRQITRGLRPYQLDRLGLTQAIRAIVRQVSENNSISVATYLDSIDDIFDKESEIHVYRLVQEALNNIVKHSGATEAAIVVKNLPETVSLAIRDNGRGFNADAVENVSVREVGYGLSGMKERARILGGSLAVDSDADRGTSLAIEIPKPILKHEA